MTFGRWSSHGVASPSTAGDQPAARLHDVARSALQGCRLALAAAPRSAMAYLLSSVVAGALPTLGAWLMKLLLDSFTVEHIDVGRVTLLAAELSGVGAISAVVPAVTQYARNQTNRRVGIVVQAKLFGAVNRFDGLSRFEDPRFLDQMRIAQQAGSVAPDQLVGSTFRVLQSATTVVGFVVSLVVLQPLLAVLALGAAFPSLVLQLRQSKRKAALLWRTTPRTRRQIFFGSLLLDVAAAKEVRLFGLGQFFRVRMLAEARETNAAQRQLDLVALRQQLPLAALSAAVSALGVIWSARAVSVGTLTVGDVTVFVASLASVQSGLTLIAAASADGYQAALVFASYLGIVSLPTDLVVANDPVEVPPLRHGVEFRDVWFRYGEGDWALRGASFTIPCAASTALVGINGSGKSTVVKLMCRLYDPARGAILWDGIDIRRFRPADLRRKIGAVFQDYMSYDLTAAENVGLGDLEKTGDLDAIRRAAERVGMHDKLQSLPQGYSTMLSRIFFSDAADVGASLSGGEWQRLAVARAVVRESSELLILDEPSSGLDAEAEYEIHLTLRRHRRGRTNLLISHRLSTVRDADSIVVLDRGLVREHGTHDGLMRLGGRYASLFSTQAAGYTERAPAVPPLDGEPAGVAVEAC